jgi:3'-phosphoadenosine 5'-phosphosulfate sulfotransferase (PAPS reductase)/FAD synthetase
MLELESSAYSERGNRADDKTSDASMEERKKEGYF